MAMWAKAYTMKMILSLAAPMVGENFNYNGIKFFNTMKKHGMAITSTILPDASGSTYFTRRNGTQISTRVDYLCIHH